MPAQCIGTRKDGTSCTAAALPRSDYCFGHDPTKAEQRRAARSAGGKGRATVARIEKHMPPTLRQVAAALAAELLDARESKQTVGYYNHKVPATMAVLAGALAKLYSLVDLGDEDEPDDHEDAEE
jgi:hypothetical protein